MSNLDIKTTNGSVFSLEKSKQLAKLIYLRFGCDIDAAHAAWRRMLQNNCERSAYEKLLEGGA